MDKYTVVSVDDNNLNLMLIESMLAGMGVEIKSFLRPVEAYEYCLANRFDLILVDYMMPEMDGVSLVKKLRQNDHEVPIVMVTAVDDDDNIKLSALEAGATEFLNKPLKLYEFQARVKNLLKLRKSQLMLIDKAVHLQAEVETATKEIMNREIETLSILGRASEFKDNDTGAHISRVAKYAKLIGDELLDDKALLEALEFATPLHDVGKIGIPDSVLLKPGKLTPEEYETMKSHTIIGHDILSDSKSKYLQTGAIIARSHHERWDGNGYPDGLKGEDIPVLGRIVAICDVFDALMSVRPYKKAWTFDESMDYVVENSGIFFDPEVVRIFKSKSDEIFEISHRISDFVV